MPQAHLDRVPDVAIQKVQTTTQQAPIVGHGTVRPKSQINIVPQVNGTLVYVHPELAQGRIVPKDAVLFQIDQAAYEARVQQARGEVKSLEAGLGRHDQEAVNLGGQIETARQLLAIDENEYLTSKKLFEDEKVGTRRDLDTIQQRFLRQQSALIELENKQAIIPHLRGETQAQLESAKAQLNQAQLDLNATTIDCPFEARVESIAAQHSQFVTAHLSIATLTNVEALEISVGIDPRELRWLEASARPEALGQAEGAITEKPPVTVRWSLRGQEFRWKGRVTRFEKVDEATRTARMVVEVRREDMVAESNSSGALASSLSIGMFCTAELPSATLAGAITIPRHAIHENKWVYVFVPDAQGKDEGTLERRQVPMLRTLGDEVLVDYAGREGGEVCELASGEMVVVSKLIKPVEGMRMRLREADESVAFLPYSSHDKTPLERTMQRREGVVLAMLQSGLHGD
jgi:multidrug efflux pump subunit AcrA (membrane-fusion protein)